MFSFLRKSAPSRRTIEAIYGMIVAQARLPMFYAQLGVPDTVNGRFDMVLLHLWMVLHCLRPIEGGDTVAQALFDRFCDDMDDNLREMGVGDLTVPKRMQAFGEAFYGRTAAYDAAFAAGEADLAIALNRNILNDANSESAKKLAAYATATLCKIDRLDTKAFIDGQWQFPPFAE